MSKKDKILENLGWFALGIIFTAAFLFTLPHWKKIDVGMYNNEVVKMIYISYK